MDAADLWTAALPEIRGAMTQATYDTWLRHAQPLQYKGDLLTVGLPNAYAVDWISNRLAGLILRAVRRVTEDQTRVRFVLHADESPARLPAQDPRSPRAVGGDDDQDDVGDIIETVTSDHVAHQADGTVRSYTARYVKLKVAFRTVALRKLKGATLSVFLCLALHVDRDGISSPGIGCIMRETGYSRPSVCKALDALTSPPLRLVEKLPDPDQLRGTDQYRLRGYVWFGTQPAPALFELD